MFGLAFTVASCAPRQTSSTDTTARSTAPVAKASTSTSAPAPRQAHFVSPDERDAAIARGSVPGFAGRLLEGCRRVILLTDTTRQTAAARAYFASGFGGGCRRIRVSPSVRFDMTLLNSTTGNRAVPCRLGNAPSDLD